MATTSPSPVDAPDHGIGKAALHGAILGFIIVFVFVTGIGLWVGVPFWGAVAMGVFAGCFGGPGFGGMLGAVAFASRHEDGGAATHH